MFDLLELLAPFPIPPISVRSISVPHLVVSRPPSRRTRVRPYLIGYVFLRVSIRGVISSGWDLTIYLMVTVVVVRWRLETW